MKNFTNLKNGLVLLLLAGALSVSNQTFAQQEAMFSQYMFNTLAINPAYAGSRDVLSMTALGRYQWVGVPGAPKTFTFSMDMPISNEKMGIGLQATYDEIGIAKNTGIHLTYAYRVKVGPRSTLSFGVQGGATNVRWLLSGVQNLTDQGDNVFLGGSDRNAILPNFGGGIYLSNDKSYLGISCPQIMQNSLFNYNVTDSTGKVSSGRTKRHFFAMMGFVIGKGNFKIKPSTMLRYTQGAPLGVDGNINFWIKDKISFGVSGRISQFQSLGQSDPFDAAVGMMELQLTPQFKIGYAYDFTTNRLNDNANTKTGFNRWLGIPTHELMLRYEFGYGKNKILTPRYF
jgi:type IX secretion system PorP/SprF family membrane protein